MRPVMNAFGARGIGAPRVQPTAASAGFTILELLIAIVVFAVALLVLAFVLLSNLRGVSEDGQRTVANQTAVSIMEQVRDEIRNDAPNQDGVRRFDEGEEHEDTRVVRNIDGAEYITSSAVVPVLVEDSGSRTVVSVGGVPHAFEIEVHVTTPSGMTFEYGSVQARQK